MANKLIIMRGLPGSGKSTKARELAGDGLVLSTDDYFMIDLVYHFDPNNLAAAHAWNQTRCAAAMDYELSPNGVIENTNKDN